MNISRRRNPFVQLILYPARLHVQGEGAKESIVKSTYTYVGSRDDIDVIIVGRGSGSIEFVGVQRRSCKSNFYRTPVISAVGHETDTTIADYVADLRAPTPFCSRKELAVYDYWKTQEQVDVEEVSYRGYLRRKMEVSRLRIEV